MKKVLFTVLAGVLAGMTFAPARADDDADKKFDFNGEVRARYEYLNNYLDLTDNNGSGDANDDAVAFAPYRVMVGMTGHFAKNVVGHVDLQYLGVFGDQLTPQWGYNAPPDQFYDPYFSQSGSYGVNLYTGYLEMDKIGGSDFGARLGRQEHTYGTELFMGDNDYYGGLSFDGLRGMWQHGHNDLNFFYYKLAELNGPVFGSFPGTGGGANDSDLFGATYDWKFDTWGTVGGYILVGQDLGGAGPVGFPDSSVMTYGVRWNRGMMTGDKLNMFDWDIEVAAQSGDAGDPTPIAGGTPSVKLSGWIGEGWFAFNYKAGDSHGRVHIGALVTSGDKTSSTDKYEGFITYFGDFHAHNRFGDLDVVDMNGQQNITDFNIGYEHWFGEQHYVMLSYHNFTQTESNGASSDKLGDEIDLTYDFQYSKNLGFEVTLGQANPGEAAENFYGVTPGQGDPVQRITAQAKLNW